MNALKHNEQQGAPFSQCLSNYTAKSMEAKRKQKATEHKAD